MKSGGGGGGKGGEGGGEGGDDGEGGGGGGRRSSSGGGGSSSSSTVSNHVEACTCAQCRKTLRRPERLPTRLFFKMNNVDAKLIRATLASHGFALTAKEVRWEGGRG